MIRSTKWNAPCRKRFSPPDSFGRFPLSNPTRETQKTITSVPEILRLDQRQLFLRMAGTYKRVADQFCGQPS